MVGLLCHYLETLRERPFNLKGRLWLCATKKNILTLVLSEKKIMNETKNHNPPPFKLNGRSLTRSDTVSMCDYNGICYCIHCALYNIIM